MSIYKKKWSYNLFFKKKNFSDYSTKKSMGNQIEGMPVVQQVDQDALRQMVQEAAKKTALDTVNRLLGRLLG